MGIEFKFDKEAFERKVKEAVERMYRASASEAQRLFDVVFKTHAGKPKDEVANAVREKFRSHGWNLTETHVAVTAEACHSDVTSD